MKNITNILILTTLLFMGIQTSDANVDQTNAFDFEYECTASGGILKTDFNL